MAAVGVARHRVGSAQLLPAACRVLGVWRPVRAGLMRTGLEDTERLWVAPEARAEAS